MTRAANELLTSHLCNQMLIFFFVLPTKLLKKKEKEKEYCCIYQSTLDFKLVWMVFECGQRQSSSTQTGTELTPQILRQASICFFEEKRKKKE